MTRAGTLPSHCAVHAGFPLPCVRCRPNADIDVPRPEWMDRMRSATRAEARAGRRVADAAAAERTKDAPPRTAPARSRGKREPAKPRAAKSGDTRGVWVTFRGVKRRLKEWAEVLGVSPSTVSDRVHWGVPLDAPPTVRGARGARGTYDYERDEGVTR